MISLLHAPYTVLVRITSELRVLHIDVGDLRAQI